MYNLNRLLWLIVFVFLVTPLLAQKQAEMINKMSEEAEVIVIGKVSKTESAWDKTGSRIYTTATVKVDEYLKGNDDPSSVKIVYPGGEVGAVGELYSHMPSFATEEEVLVFLKKRPDGKEYKVLSGENGKIALVTDEKTNEKTTTSNINIETLKARIKSIVEKQQ